MKPFGLDLINRRLSLLLLILLLFINQSCNAEVDKKDLFLQEIREVDGYVLIAGNLVKTIPLVNLRVIRGKSLYKNSALYISSNFNENNVAHGLEELPMRQLKEILQGAVTIAKNDRLCNLDTIKWKDIVHSGNDIVINQSPLPHCPTCVVNCNGSCWGSGPENCQILTKLNCAQQCHGRCSGPYPSDCCHSQCAAGCTGPKETDCLACLKFRDGDTCLESCSLTNTYNVRKNLLEPIPKKYSFGSSCVKKCPYNYIVSDSGSCIQSCGIDTYTIRNIDPGYFMLQEKDKKSDWTESGQTSINNVLKHNTYIKSSGKEIYNITTKLDKPTGDVISDKKVCPGTANRFSRIGTVEDHYNYLKKKYQGCEIVLGNLEITNMRANSDLSFLKDIQEVGGYVLIAMNSAKSIPLGNLRIIRGETLFEKNAALSILSNYAINMTDALEELPMRRLQEIIHGGVLIRNNPKLCNVHTIQWEDIVHSNYNISVEKTSPANCFECDKACSGSCWSLGPENCQILTKLVCDQTCPGRCWGPKPSDCCDHKCAAGCTGPKETDCLACKLVRDVHHDKCLEFCSPLHILNDVHPVESNTKDSCVIKCPVNYMVTDCGTCVEKCSPGSYMVEEYGALRCKKCDGPCPKGRICMGIGYGNLKHTIAVNASNIDDFENCTIVLGSIVILKYSISGDRFTNTSAMDPAKLNILRSIREITGYLLIQWWPEDYTDLSIFENLEVIRGRPKYDWRYALVVTDVSISSLGLKSLKEVSDGDVIIGQSKDLCYADTINWTRILRTNRRITITNKNLEECVAEGKICDASCSEDGCWGPGPSQCFSHHGN